MRAIPREQQSCWLSQISCGQLRCGWFFVHFGGELPAHAILCPSTRRWASGQTFGPKIEQLCVIRYIPFTVGWWCWHFSLKENTRFSEVRVESKAASKNRNNFVDLRNYIDLSYGVCTIIRSKRECSRRSQVLYFVKLCGVCVDCSYNWYPILVYFNCGIHRIFPRNVPNNSRALRCHKVRIITIPQIIALSVAVFLLLLFKKAVCLLELKSLAGRETFNQMTHFWDIVSKRIYYFIKCL